MPLLKHPLRQALLLILVLCALILQSAFSVEQARTRLIVAAAKEVDVLWALSLEDATDEAASAYLRSASEGNPAPPTFRNEYGNKQPLFRAEDDDYWRPERYAQEALDYSKSHDDLLEHNLRDQRTRSIWQGLQDQAVETGRALGEQITTAPWGTVKAVSGAIASGAWAVGRHPLQSAENFGEEVLRLGKDAAFNLGSGATSAWAGHRGAENPLNELYGQNMGPTLLSLGSAQGVLAAAQAIPMMKGAQALGKGMQALGKGALQAGGKIKIARKLPEAKNSIFGGKKLSNVSAIDANSGFSKPPYDPSKAIVDFKADGTTQYVRVYNMGPNSSQGGKWMMKADDIRNLSPQQIKDKFDLPELPTHVTDVKPPKGTKIRTGSVSSGNFGGTGGGTQFQLKSKISDDAFTNPRSLQ